LNALTLEEPETLYQRNFLKAVRMVCEGLCILGERYASLARHKAKKTDNPERTQELKRIAEICNQIPKKPARNLWEALQSTWFYLTALWMESNAPTYSLGKVDQHFYPYYKKDIENEQLTKDDGLELIELFNLKIATRIRLLSEEDVKHFSGYMAFQTTVIGGETPDGRNGINELSYLFLQSKNDLRLNQPSLKVILSKKNPYLFWMEVAKLIREGTGYPALYNHTIGKQMVMDKGVPVEEAQNWVPHGCVEAVLSGNFAQITDIGHYNAPAAIEFVFTNGKKKCDPYAGTSFGLDSKDLSEIESFEGFLGEVKRQLRHLIGNLQTHGIALTKAYRELYPLPVESILIDGCIENGRDRMRGGAKYNAGYAFILTGVADLADSLMAVKKLAYDEKKYTLGELNEALQHNFEGYEEIHSQCLKAPKYGNDILEVDLLARDLTDYCGKIAKSFTDVNGFQTGHGLFPVTSHVPMGKAIGALPSGRRAGKPLGDGVSPAQGMDKHGPTAVMKSVTRLNHAHHNTGTLLNQKFTSDALSNETYLENFVNLIKTYFDLGGYHVQFNVVDADTLRAAQEHPVQYKDLLVRVAGYSAYFVELNPEIQEEIISRTTHSRV
ncbi:MAG: hypothetical protein GWO20_11605, partial [Candidatus Korarchaeota archaeon]|nr:hypothetical protein [Candidatus Korarchaeota archaeon]NIU84084.1 hypothetical protein [Candidatus Thorarchaeota archaeon]NIW14223.1 hypothetical protein [Candidatus Thorarchaeota archaeon]NIW52320.1 hypothetical protein [Candidatus Korarchaeota archaeon]